MLYEKKIVLCASGLYASVSNFNFRCGCPVKCRKKVITITKWPQMSNKNDNNHARRYALFWFQPYCKIFSYHILYTGSDLVADIGGYLGLFLGLSVFGLVQLLEKAILESKKAERSGTIKSLKDSMKVNINLD